MKRWTIPTLAAFVIALGSVLAVPLAARQAGDETAAPEAVAEAADEAPLTEAPLTEERLEAELFVGEFVEIYSRSDPNSTILIKNARRGFLCGQEFITGEGIDVGVERGDEWMEGRRVWHAAEDVSLIIEFDDEDDYLGALERQAPTEEEQAISYGSVCEAPRSSANAVVAAVSR